MSIRSNVDARRLDQRVTFQRKVTGQDLNGDPTPAQWVDVATVWACVNSARADDIASSVVAEVSTSGTIVASRFYMVWIRWRDDITADMRAVWTGRFLDIQGVPDNGKRGRLLALPCYEGLNDGS